MPDKFAGPVCLIAVSLVLLTLVCLHSEPPAEESLVVMTLNVAHGRGDRFHQALVPEKEIRRSLADVAACLSQNQPDAAALQEADGPSIWSGRFNHVQTLARDSGLVHWFRGRHVDAMNLSYGTALLSRSPLHEPVSVRFAASPPTPTKGFVCAVVETPISGSKVALVSVHLDFSRSSVRARQVERMVRDLIDLRYPLIVMGDFNCDWDSEETLPLLARELGLRRCELPSADTPTFPSKGTRLDWILISKQLEFIEYRVLPDVLSDHRAVIAVVAIPRSARRPARAHIRPRPNLRMP